MSTPPDRYTHGHDASVLRSHNSRTVENSAAHLVPHLRAGRSLLDIGCGPGTITSDLAKRVAPGEVIGIDPASEVIAAASAQLDDDVANCTFRTGDVYRLDFGDNTFDIVHAHQVLQHLTDPVAALREMRRVTKPGGVVSVRDADYGGMTWAPHRPLLDRWLELYHQLTHHNDAEADAGRYLLGWVQAAGFSEITPTSSTWTFAEPEARLWWGDLWANRIIESNFGAQAKEFGFADDAELAELAAAWREWAAQPDGFFVCPHAECIAIA